MNDDVVVVLLSLLSIPVSYGVGYLIGWAITKFCDW